MKQNRKNLAIIAIGGAGNSILDSLIQADQLIVNPSEQALFVNFSESDLREDLKSNKIILDGRGTGRSTQKGLELLKEKKDVLQKNYSLFYQKVLKHAGTDDVTFVVISSLGGGTGSSLTPFTLDFFTDLIARESHGGQVAYVGIVSSPKEGAVTLPNCIKSFNAIYNQHVLTEKLRSCFLIDNRLFEKQHGFSTYDFKSMNGLIIDHLAEMFDEENYRAPAAGFQTLDVNEVRRVLSWGKGVADFQAYDFSFKKKADEEHQDVSIHSSIFGGKFKSSSAKAVACYVQIKKKDFDMSESELKQVSDAIVDFKKKFSGAFFVFGYSFNNKTIRGDFRFRVIINGLDFPHSFETDVARATKAVTKLKQENHKFEIAQGADLEF